MTSVSQLVNEAVSEPVNEPVAWLTIIKNTVYKLEAIQFQIEVLSKRFEGDVWVVAHEEEGVRTVGRFTVHLVKKLPGEGRIALFWRLYHMILKRCRQIERTNMLPKALWTYDPFRNGLLGVLIGRRLAWPAVLEVNGSYARPENFTDMEGYWNRLTKPYQFRAVGGYALSHADGVRLLYHNQLSGLAKLPQHVAVRHFFDNVPLERFSPGPEEPILLHVGYPYHRKGIDVLLDAWARVRDEFPTWRVVLIGHQLMEHIKVAPPRVEVLAPMPNTEVAKWMSRCGVYVLASRSEAMGRVLIEAAASAKPRIASRVDGTYTVLEDEVDGLMFRSEDAEDLADKMRRLMRDPALRRRYGEAARARALVEFTEEAYNGRVAELVRAVVAAKDSHRWPALPKREAGSEDATNGPRPR